MLTTIRGRGGVRRIAVGWLLAAAPAGLAGGAGPVVDVDFESRAAGPYTDEMAREDWGTLPWSELFDRARIVADPDPAGERGQVLRVAYPKGTVGPGQGGGQFVAALPPSDERWLSYRVRFSPGFDFAKGGKLPGLTSGGGRFTGGRRPTNGEGWSARYMWRTGGAAVVYLYHVDMAGAYGDDLPLRRRFVPGRWHRLVQRIRLNAPDASDGVMEIWFDGQKVLSRSDIRFRIGEQGRIDSLYFSTFHGGATSDWAPAKDGFAYFDDFLVCESSTHCLDRGWVGGWPVRRGGLSSGRSIRHP